MTRSPSHHDLNQTLPQALIAAAPAMVAAGRRWRTSNASDRRRRVLLGALCGPTLGQAEQGRRHRRPAAANVVATAVTVFALQMFGRVRRCSTSPPAPPTWIRPASPDEFGWW